MTPAEAVAHAARVLDGAEKQASTRDFVAVADQWLALAAFLADHPEAREAPTHNIDVPVIRYALRTALTRLDSP